MNLLFANDNETFDFVDKHTVGELKYYFEQRLARSGEPSAEGFSWEYYLSARLIEILKDSPQLLFGEQWNQLNNQPVSLHNAECKPLTSSPSVKVTFAQFLENPKTAFYLPEKEAGPDLVFFLKVGSTLMPCFVQCKLGLSASCDAGFRTTNPNYFYHLRKAPYSLPEKYQAVHEKIKEILEKYDKHMGILIAYPGNWTYKVVSRYSEKEKRGRFEQLFDKKNAKLILDEKHLQLLDHLKQRT
jgi:hypothetical protein